MGVGDVAEDEAELVAAEPGHGVAGAHVGADAPRQFGEEQIPAVMAEGVVDVPEVVEVDDRHRRRPPARTSAAPRSAPVRNSARFGRSVSVSW